MCQLQIVINEQIVDQVVSYDAALFPVGEHRDNGKLGSRVYRRRAHDLSAVGQHQSPRVQLGNHPLSCFWWLDTGGHIC